MQRSIYLDNAATTPMAPEVANAMEPFLLDQFGNPSTFYEYGEKARNAIEDSRNRIGDLLGADSSEIYFTGGGTEADNWAIKGIGLSRSELQRSLGNHLITTQLEHHAILNSCDYLEKMGVEISYARPNPYGLVSPEQIEKLTRRNTRLISVMHANNEIGTVEPIDEIGKMARQRGIIFHTDAVQTMGHIPINLKDLPIDMLSASAHKFNGPKGIGFLFVRKNIELQPFIHGGAQERGKRAGTENVAGIVGMARALELSYERMSVNRRKVKEMRNYLVRRVLDEIEDVIYNGSHERRLPGNASFSFKGIDAQMLLVLLAEQGIFASAGSACNSEKREVSHVIKAIGVHKEYAPGTIRFSLDHNNSMEEIAIALSALKESVSILRMV